MYEVLVELTDTDHYLVVARLRESLAVSNKQHRSWRGKDLSQEAK